MRILVAHSGNMYGGLERALDTLALIPVYCPGVSVAFALCFDGPSAESLRRRGVTPHILGDVRMTRLDQVLRARRQFAQVVRDTTPDVVITPAAWTHALFAPVVRRMRLPLVHWVHDELTGATWIERLAARHQPDLLICNSHFSLRAARAVFPRVASAVVYCPLVFEEPRAERAAVRAAIGTPPDAVVISHVARMTPWKGQALLVEALERLQTSVPWECWLVGGAQSEGDRTYQEQIRRRVESSAVGNQVRLLGQRSDIADLLVGSDLYCHPSLNAEPFGLAIVEALYAQLPVVASAAGGPAEIVSADCGRLVAPGDTDALALALRGLVVDADTRARMSTAGRDRAITLCDASARLQDLVSAIEPMISESAA